jgi:DNA-binding IclR family transcriptional regulator
MMPQRKTRKLEATARKKRATKARTATNRKPAARPANGPDSDHTAKPSRPLERYVQVLEMLAAFPDSLALPELAQILHLPKTTVYRLLHGLEESRLIAPARGRGGGYVLAPRLLRLLHLGSPNSVIELLSQERLKELAEATNLTAYLAKLTGHTVHSTVMRAPSAHWCLYVVPGSAMAPHATASAKAILAHQPRSVQETALEGTLQKLTANTKTEKIAVLAEYEQVRRAGFATCLAEDVDGFGAIACPVEIENLGVLYSVGITGPLDVIFRGPTQTYLDQLKSCAQQLAQSLRHGARMQHIENAVSKRADAADRANIEKLFV